MGDILPDGRQVGVRNDHPRLFDLSFVFIGADRTAKVMAKLASGGHTYLDIPEQILHLPSAQIPAVMSSLSSLEKTAAMIPGMDARRISKTEAKDVLEKAPAVDPAAARISARLLTRAVRLPGASSRATKKAILAAAKKVEQARGEKTAAKYKLSDIEKIIDPDGVHGKILKRLEASDKDLDDDTLDRLAHHGEGSQGMGEILSTLSSMGIVLKPREFQRIIIIRCGNRPMADDLDSRGSTFAPVDEVDQSLPMGKDMISDVIRSLMMPRMNDRTCLGQPFRKRVIAVITPKGNPDQAEPTLEKNAFLDQVSAAYNGYRLGLIDMIPDITQLVEDDPQVLDAVYDGGMEELFGAPAQKTAGIGPLAKGALPLIFALAPLIWLSSGHWKAQEIKGEKLPAFKKLIAEHPYLATAASVGGGGHSVLGLDRRLMQSAALRRLLRVVA
jgi:hypothetical protein